MIFPLSKNQSWVEMEMNKIVLDVMPTGWRSVRPIDHEEAVGGGGGNGPFRWKRLKAGILNFFLKWSREKAGGLKIKKKI